MSEKLLELSSVVNVLSRTVADLEKQRQQNETRMALMQALAHSIIGVLSSEQRGELSRKLDAAVSVLMAQATPAGRAILKREIAEVQAQIAQLF
jgi:hypothetical protein